MSSKKDMLQFSAMALRKAASKIQQLYEDNEKLATELLDLKKEACESQKFEEAMKIASLMHEKGLISKTAVEAQAHEISQFDDKAKDLLEASLMRLDEKTASEGVEELSSIMYNGDINEFSDYLKKKSMADEIISLADDSYV